MWNVRTGTLASLGLLLTAQGSASTSLSPVDFAQARQEIMNFAGCYQVEYTYKEYEALVDDYKLKPSKTTYAYEWIVADDRGEVIDLQHILTMKDFALKHWRQRWQYESPSVLTYQGEQTWTKSANKKIGTWTQKVFQVDDSPRYECSSAWYWDDDGPFWQCEAAAPLPRRDATTRDDYQIMIRNNLHRNTNEGWIHGQDNTKLVVDEKDSYPLVKERGLNSYKKVDPSFCQSAQDYWSEFSLYWNIVVDVWDDVYSEAETIQIQGPTPLWQEIFQMVERAKNQKQSLDAFENDFNELIRSRI
ncbi:DUF6607 family protein [Pseudobacteriovorax antillogorgiicola]|uniref:YARHG domain-containing protein n=1 Tax=Pseudobacteriovorax antillogorgiicola TaxID=1513793 RepID=A0A1Y6BNA8_9BACT|nr:DUF6607 family protein [Pseudobacteriovorax antillogorgiicola]TCS55439.1 hypothetical protein EDD56_105160 [Pseudobacteriovorax antillogorgiicola]SMF12432.1 hypothetical protein SAMN06296036_105164 [Pseudobacteriovorax antillogorgiicola]